MSFTTCAPAMSTKPTSPLGASSTVCLKNLRSVSPALMKTIGVTVVNSVRAVAVAPAGQHVVLIGQHGRLLVGSVKDIAAVAGIVVHMRPFACAAYHLKVFPHGVIRSSRAPEW